MKVDLSPAQSAVYDDPTKFRVWVAGRRSGKTTLELVEHVTRAGRSPDQRNWYIGPTYTQAKKIAWKPLKQMVPRSWVAKTNESELMVELHNGSEIRLAGADDPDSLRGPGLDFVTPDEFAFWKDPAAWWEVLLPALSDRDGDALFGTTPAGYNWSYDLAQMGMSPEHPEWSFHTCTTIEAGFVPETRIEEFRRIMDPRQFRQEFEASFETLAGRVYDTFDRYENVDEVEEPTPDHEWEPKPDILVGMDFNVNPMSAVIGVRAADELHILDALEIMTSNTDEMAAELHARYPNRNVIVCPDPSGKARKTSAAGKTDFSILESAGFEVRAPAAAPPVRDRINNTKAMLLNAEGRRRVLVHPRATRLIRSWDGLTYKDGTSVVDKTLGLDHIADAADYLIWQEFNVLVDRTFRTADVVG